jgi:hypothetical protein
MHPDKRLSLRQINDELAALTSFITRSEQDKNIHAISDHHRQTFLEIWLGA